MEKQVDEIDLMTMIRMARDARSEPVRFLFELAAFYVLLIAVPLAISTGVSYLLDAALPEMAKRNLWVLGISLALFLVVLIGINMSFDGTVGQYRKLQVQRVACRYGYPIVLALGLFMGWQYHVYSGRDQWEHQAEQAVLAACYNLPHCVILAKRINGGNDVEQYRRTK